ncbi:MAG: hypothetical protein WCG31_04755 [Deltaproteobacteria bacterium]
MGSFLPWGQTGFATLFKEQPWGQTYTLDNTPRVTVAGAVTGKIKVAMHRHYS